jgi:hypothetical protein
MPPGDVSPNREFFASLCESGKQAVVARRLGVSLNTLRKLVAGTPVARGTIEAIAERLKVNIDLLFAQPTTHLLPDDPEFYESLCVGYFLDHDRRAFGLVQWWEESVSITQQSSYAGDVIGVHFNGFIKNQWGNRFSIQAVLTNRHHFSVIGTHRLSVSDGDRGVITFDASFSQCFDGVLSGFWSGINHFESAPSLFRIFLAARPLGKAEISKLSMQVRVELHCQSDDFGFGD